MKAFVLLLMISIAFGARVSAQDIIHKKDKTTINAKITKIGSQEIEYKRFDYQEGPSYAIDRAEVIMIVYQNGQREIINAASSEAAIISTDKDKKKSKKSAAAATEKGSAPANEIKPESSSEPTGEQSSPSDDSPQPAAITEAADVFVKDKPSALPKDADSKIGARNVEVGVFGTTFPSARGYSAAGAGIRVMTGNDNSLLSVGLGYGLGVGSNSTKEHRFSTFVTSPLNSQRPFMLYYKVGVSYVLYSTSNDERGLSGSYWEAPLGGGIAFRLPNRPQHLLMLGLDYNQDIRFKESPVLIHLSYGL